MAMPVMNIPETMTLDRVCLAKKRRVVNLTSPGGGRSTADLDHLTYTHLTGACGRSRCSRGTNACGTSPRHRRRFPYTNLTNPLRRGDRPLSDERTRFMASVDFRLIGEAPRMRLLIVEDNEELAQLLVKGLQTAGYEADVLSTIEEATSVLLTTFYAALILDLGLPDGDGLALLREIRHRNNPIPVLVLTARGGLHDYVHGLRSGAGDYLVKPFALEELVARLEAQLRRPGQLLGNSLKIANLQFDTQNRQASIDDQPQVLSARETAVLELLMRSKGRVVSKKQVEDHIFGHSGEVASNAVEVYVHRLRKQLADRGAKVQVHTIRGVGYLIAEEK